MPPPFISLDGLDGTGKSTQCGLLGEWLSGRGFEVIQCVDPGTTTVGDMIRALLLDNCHRLDLRCEALLFMASRARLVAEIIQPALASGRAVISDRFLLANVVYQGHAGGLDPDLLWDVGHMATGGLEPDLTLVLDLPIEEARQRRGRPPDRVESRDGPYQHRVREGFLTEARRRPDKIRIINANQSVHAVHADICREVADHVLKR